MDGPDTQSMASLDYVATPSKLAKQKKEDIMKMEGGTSLEVGKRPVDSAPGRSLPKSAALSFFLKI